MKPQTLNIPCTPPRPVDPHHHQKNKHKTCVSPIQNTIPKNRFGDADDVATAALAEEPEFRDVELEALCVEVELAEIMELQGTGILAEMTLMAAGSVSGSSTGRGSGKFRPTEHAYSPRMTTVSNNGQTKLANDVCMLTLPLTSAREGSSRIWMFPVISTFPVTDFKERKSMVKSFGFRAMMKLDPTVVRSGNVSDVRVG